MSYWDLWNCFVELALCAVVIAQHVKLRGVMSVSRSWLDLSRRLDSMERWQRDHGLSDRELDEVKEVMRCHVAKRGTLHFVEHLTRADVRGEVIEYLGSCDMSLRLTPKEVTPSPPKP